jgi:hypothetical protein
MVRLVLAKRCEILVFRAEKRRLLRDEKWIWRFALTFVSFDQAKENKKHN